MVKDDLVALTIFLTIVAAYVVWEIAIMVTKGEVKNSDGDRGIEKRVEIGYVRMQGVAYFLFALLFARSAQHPDFGFNSEVFFTLPTWMPLSLAIICLAISFFFFGTLFFKSLIPSAVRVATGLTFPFYTVMLASYIASWLGGLPFLQGLSKLWFNVFFWSGTAGFIVLVLHFFVTPLRNRIPNEWVSFMKKLMNYTLSKRKSCLECGYLALPQVATKIGGEILEPPRPFRFHWKNENMLEAISGTLCYRGVWDARNNPDDRDPEKVLRPRICPRFYPYIGGAPAEHAESHRARTNRRWVVAGGLIGSYVATSTGFIASEVVRNGGAPLSLFRLVLLGLIGLAVIVFIINITLNRY